MYRLVLDFWFDEIPPAKWWAKDDALDAQITERFSDLHQSASQCELFEWRSTPEGRLAEIIVLDQFSRNIYRNSPLAFANDALALALSQEAISIGADKLLSPIKQSFLYLPFMHSESAAIHEVALELFSAAGMETNHDFEIKHKNIIDRFGRYPHRNDVLGRTSTEQEKEFLKQPGSSF